MSSLDDSRLTCEVCGSSGGDKRVVLSSTKKCTSCEQKNSEHCKDGAADSSTSGNSRIDAVSDILGRLDISNNDDDDKLFADPPPKEDCEICMLSVPFSENICNVFTSYQPCCGKTICYGCVMAAEKEMEKGNMKRCCPFCRLPLSKTDKEDFKRLKKRMKLNDANAFYDLGGEHATGGSSLPMDFMKTLNLWNKAAELGSIKAHYRLGFSYFQGEGIEKDSKKALQHYKLAAIGGHEMARHNLGCMEMSNGNMVRAMKHFIIAARSGLDVSLKKVGLGYKRGYVTKDDYASTLRAYQASWDEMKSEQRIKAMVIAKQKLSQLPYNKHMNL